MSAPSSESNTANSDYATVGGGQTNTANGNDATVGGGVAGLNANGVRESPHPVRHPLVALPKTVRRRR